MSKLVELAHQYHYHPNDLAVALYRIIEKRYGADRLIGIPDRWFPWRRLPISLKDVQTGLNEQAKGLSGFFRIQGIKGSFFRDGSIIRTCVQKEFQDEVASIIEEITKQLKNASIYRGKPITVAGRFLDLSQIHEEALVYSDSVLKDLRAHVWAPIERPEVCRRLGIKLPRKILFSGQFGSGKTMATLLTAKKATQNNWTFLCVEAEISEYASKTIAEILDIAVKYQPTVISIEDIDREQRQHDQFALGNFMASLDGPISKSAEILILMTTNYIEKVAAGIHRPGRIDKVIDFNRFDGTDAWNLLNRAIPVESLALNINKEKVMEACKGYQAAFVKEVATAAKLKAISSSLDNSTPVVTEEMIIDAASDLRLQHKLCTTEQVGFRN